MRYWVSAVLFTTLLVGGCQPASTELSDAQRADITSQVNEAVGGLFGALNVHDPDQILSHYLDSDDFAYVGTMSILVSREALASVVASYHSRHPEVTFTHRIVHTQVVSPTVAVVFSEGGSSDAEHLVWTHVLVRGEDGRWVVAYEHEAWPNAEPLSRHPGM
jgi:ketosteroid isomerase-like protein